jgi:hypothetical protein
MFTMLLTAIAAMAHPIHSSSAAVRWNQRSETAFVTIKAFADDFPPGADSARVVAYLRDHLTFSSPNGEPARIVVTGVAKRGNVIETEARFGFGTSLVGWRVANRILCERFTDQLNVVRLAGPRDTVTLLFSPGDSPKVIS